MNRIKLSLCLAAAATMGLVACLKNNNNNNIPSLTPKQQQLMQLSWKLTKITIPGVHVKDSSIGKPCISDDQFTFGSDGYYYFKDGTMRCDSTAILYGVGQWGIKKPPTEDSLFFAIGNNKAIAWKILNLNDSVLQTQFNDTARKALKTYTFKH